jgi:KAP family P-loop domain
MWPDNETTIDLLGFDYLVDSLEVVLTDPRLLPVTVGVLGDWGSGKSSLLQMVGTRLGDDDGYVVVSFSPWRYQGYEDVKAALMEAVLEAVAHRFPPDDEAAEKLIRRLRHKIARIMAGPIAAGRVLAPAAGALSAAHAGLPIEFGTAAGTALIAGADAVASELETAPGTQEHEGAHIEPNANFESVARFSRRVRSVRPRTGRTPGGDRLDRRPRSVPR